jgi:phosphoglycolate phosphatase-like HAD superfamily hydrolase
VRVAFQDECSKLIGLPPNPFPASRVEEVKVGKTPYVRFDGNDYSVPHDRVRRVLTAVADECLLRVVEGTEVVASHERSYDKDEQVEDPAHIEALVEDKRRARKARASDRLVRSVPSVPKLLDELARRGANMGSACNRLLRLLDEYGKERIEVAVREVLSRETPEPRSVRLVLERMSLDEGRAPRVPVYLPDDPRVRDVVVRPHTLDSYGVLGRAGREVDDVQGK